MQQVAAVFLCSGTSVLTARCQHLRWFRFFFQPSPPSHHRFSPHLTRARAHAHTLSLYDRLRGNCTTGQLTLLGAEQCVRLGKAFRALYVDRLGARFDVSQFFLRSTDVVRTRQSAMAFVEGMYPPSMRPAGWRVIMHTSPSAVETVNGNPSLCPRISQLSSEFAKDPEWVSRWQALQPTIKRCNGIAGTSGSSWENSADSWFDVLVARQCNGLPYPCNENRTECITRQDAEAVYAVRLSLPLLHLPCTHHHRRAQFANWSVAFTHTNAEYGKLVAGLFLQDIMALLAAAVEGTSSFRHAHVSGHDSTLLALLNAFQVEMPFPLYASHMEFELWKAPAVGGFGLRLLYNGSPIAPPECPAGGELCPWKTFVQMIADRLTIRNYAKECAKH